MSDYLDPNNEELLQDYFAEAESQVEQLESNILVLEHDKQNRDAVDEIFRAAHTLKGASATVQMDEITRFTHTLEDVFDAIRTTGSGVTGELVDVLLAAVDTIKNMLEARASGEVYHEDYSHIVHGLEAAVDESPGPESAAARPVAPPATSGAAAARTLSASQLRELRDAADDALGAEAQILQIDVDFDPDNPMNTVGGIQVFAAMKSFGVVLRSEPDFEQLYGDEFFPRVVYFLATQESAEAIESGVAISDVTTSVTARAIHDIASAPSESDARATGTDSSTQISLQHAAEDDAGESRSPEAANEPEHTDGDERTVTEKRKTTPSSSVLRVDSRRVDNLLNLVSETVINKAAFNQISSDFAEVASGFAGQDEAYRAQLRELFDSLPDYLARMQSGASSKEIKREISERFGSLDSVFDEVRAGFRQTVAKFRSTAQNLGRITGELQEGVMRIRMVPISQIFSRFPRLVRDLTRSLNKDVELKIEGQDTELDKSVIEDLLDPLIHCVRNSIDHGIEGAEDRAESGKPQAGELILRARSEGNMIIIEIADDGRGIDVAAVRAKAIERGVIHPSKALSDLEAFNLIFDPGFSTAKKVSDISGRGVGLDVVRKQIEKLNGTVTVWSEQGRGTTFTIKIPLTLAIIQGLMVRVGRETYAIPITAVVESHRIKPSEIRTLDNHEVLNVREDVISLLRLNRIFRIESTTNSEYYFVVIVGSGDKKVGLVVDSLIGEEDVVIKPLRDKFTNAPGIAGANITGDGRVSLIIDVAQLLELGLKHERDERRRREAVIGR
jgi:two-component system chemotaxis sensor kinase CheA